VSSIADLKVTFLGLDVSKDSISVGISNLVVRFR
jgi:hypothetical protein